MPPYLKDEPVYAIYAAMDSAALLALLPELDHWRETSMRELRLCSDTEAQWPERDAATYESLNDARAAWHSLLEREADPQTAEGIRALLDKIDETKAWLGSKTERHQESALARSRQVSERLHDLMRRRMVAVKVLSDRAILPTNLVGE